MDINEITGAVVDAAMRVHTALGPGLLEGAYEACLIHELRKRGHSVASQVPQPIMHDGLTVDVGYRIALLVADVVIVEVKAVETLRPVHAAQLLSYLRLSGRRVGLI